MQERRLCYIIQRCEDRADSTKKALMVVEIMKNPEDFTMENMKADIAKAGNLFYQYRACRRIIFILIW